MTFLEFPDEIEDTVFRSVLVGYNPMVTNQKEFGTNHTLTFTSTSFLLKKVKKWALEAASFTKEQTKITLFHAMLLKKFSCPLIQSTPQLVTCSPVTQSHSWVFTDSLLPTLLLLVTSNPLGFSANGMDSSLLGNQ